jgi:protein TonB
MTSALTISNLLAWSAQVALLVGAGLLTMRVVRLEAPAVRYALLRVLLAVCLLLPLLQPYRAGNASIDASFRAVAAAGRASGGAGVTTPDAGGLFDAAASWPTAVMLVLLAGVVSRLVWIGAGVVRLRRLRRAGELASSSDEQEELQGIIRASATVRYVRSLGQPVTFGFRSPIVLLPDSLRQRPVAIQRAVLAHELWHVRRRDWIWTVAEEGVRALFWFHPAIWALLSRIQCAREEVVDELTILATGSRRSYVDALLAFADEPPLFAATAFARRRHLVQRMVLISKEAVMSARRMVACCAVLAAVLIPASWYAVQAFPLVQLTSAEGGLDRIGPVEQRARAITPENPIPRRTQVVGADYPSEAEALGMRGTVTVRLALDESGRVAEARPVAFSLRANGSRSIGYRSNSAGFNEPAAEALAKAMPAELRAAARGAFESLVLSSVRAVKQWRYDPPAEGPIAFSVNVPFGPAEAGGPPPPPPPPPPAPGRQAGSARPLRVGGNISAPTKIKNVNPVYPDEAKDAKVQGVVIIETRVEADGTVGEAHILKSIPMLDEAALEAVRQWEFMPTHLNGQPVPVIMTVTVNFTLQ